MRSRLQFSHLKLCDRASNLAIIVPLKLIMRSRFQIGYYRTTQIEQAIALKNLAIFGQYQADSI